MKYLNLLTIVSILYCSTNVAFAGTVTANSVTLCTNYTEINADAAGSVTLTGCTPPSTNARFTLTVPSTAQTGSATPVTVTRTVDTGSIVGQDTLTLTSNLTGTFTPVTLSYSPTEVTTTAKISNITFTTAGIGTVVVTENGLPVATSPPITVTAQTTSNCTNTLPVTKDLGNMPAGGGVKYSISGPIALRFQVNHNDLPGTRYYIQYEESVPLSEFNPVETTVSTCAGDFTAVGMTGTLSKCKVTQSMNAPALSVSEGSACRVEPGIVYYINIKPSGAHSAFVFMLI